jgi:hypothetical protein
MDLELEPPQPDQVSRALGELLQAVNEEPDPWWQAGIDEALDDDA